MNDPEQQLEIAINAIRKKYGENSLRYGDEQDAIGRISTGSLAFDYATGGGIPIGRFSRFYGGFSSCKSLTCWRVIKQAQAQGMTCAYYNIEKQYDRSLVERIGIDSKSLMVVEGTTIEETSAKMEALLGSVDLHNSTHQKSKHLLLTRFIFLNNRWIIGHYLLNQGLHDTLS